MPAKMGVGAVLQGFLTLSVDNHDGKGPQLVSSIPTGQTPAIVSADTSDFTAALDATPVPAPPDPVTGLVPVTAASFTVTSPASPSQPNVPVTITFNLTNDSDGSAAAAPLVDTIEVDETLAPTEVLGDLFGTPVAAA